MISYALALKFNTTVYYMPLRTLKQRRFAMLYVHQLPQLSPSASYRLIALVRKLEFNSNGAWSREELIEILEINTANFARDTRELLDKGVLKKIKGKYYLSPRFVWQGTERLRAARMKHFYASCD